MIDIDALQPAPRGGPAPAALILVGDGDQLPSVGPGNVLADLIAIGVPSRWCGCTTSSARPAQARSSSTLTASTPGSCRVAPGAEGGGDFFFIERAEPQAIMETIRRDSQRCGFPRKFGLDPRRDVQVLTPMRRGLLGSANMNKELQALLNPRGPVAHARPLVLRAGDRVMQTVNNYELGVFNGDIGSVEEASEARRRVIVRYDDRHVRYEWSDLDELVPAYACSIHKSQGSEFPAVVIALHTAALPAPEAQPAVHRGDPRQAGSPSSWEAGRRWQSP